MKIAIVDDELVYCEMVTQLLEDNHSVQPFHDAVHFFKEVTNFDIAILDIDLPDMSGLEIAKQIQNKNIPIIFLTSHAEKVFHAFGKNVYKFILKQDIHTLPCVISELMEDMNKESSLVLSVPRSDVRLRYDKIFYIEYNHRQLIIYTETKSYIIHNCTFDYIFYRLDKRFCKVFRSIAVNLDHVSSFKQQNVIMDNGVELPISRSEARNVKTAYARRILND